MTTKIATKGGFSRSNSQRGCNVSPTKPFLVWAFCLAAVLVLGTGCRTVTDEGAFSPAPPEKLTLTEGDSIRVVFPGAADLSTVQQIRRDGKITIPVLGEVKASGLSPAEVEAEILKTYGSQLVTKQVTVTLESGNFPVFVSGAVLRPGRVTSDRPITALQAIMEAGGFDQSRANTKAVRIIRHEGGQVRNITINLQRTLDGKDPTPFYLKASDIVFVPEKFAWF